VYGRLKYQSRGIEKKKLKVVDNPPRIKASSIVLGLLKGKCEIAPTNPPRVEVTFWAR
jgi:hypothetical protein